MRAMVGVNARIAHRRRRHRTRASFRLGPWVVLAVLVSLVVPGAFAAPFADRTALKAAVDSCITLDPTGVACCNHGADCGAAGPVEMAGLGRVAGDEHERAVLRQRVLQRGYIAMGHLERHEHVPDVPRCQGVQPGYRCMGYLARHDHAADVLRRRRLQPGYRYMGHLERHDHVPDVRDARAFNQDIGTWDHLERHDHDGCSAPLQPISHGTSSVTTMGCSPRVQSAPIEMGRQLGHDHEADVLRRQRIQHDAGGLGHIQSHGFYLYFQSAAAWKRGSRAATTTPSPAVGRA